MKKVGKVLLYFIIGYGILSLLSTTVGMIFFNEIDPLTEDITHVEVDSNVGLTRRNTLVKYYDAEGEVVDKFRFTYTDGVLIGTTLIFPDVVYELDTGEVTEIQGINSRRMFVSSTYMTNSDKTQHAVVLVNDSRINTDYYVAFYNTITNDYYQYEIKYYPQEVLYDDVNDAFLFYSPVSLEEATFAVYNFDETTSRYTYDSLIEANLYIPLSHYAPSGYVFEETANGEDVLKNIHDGTMISLDTIDEETKTIAKEFYNEHTELNEYESPSLIYYEDGVYSWGAGANVRKSYNLESGEYNVYEVEPVILYEDPNSVIYDMMVPQNQVCVENGGTTYLYTLNHDGLTINGEFDGKQCDYGDTLLYVK